MHRTLSNRTGRGFTIVELLVVVSIIALLIAILLPAIGKARDAALVTQSLANLRNLSAANSAYGADWSDRQFTAIPDDAGLVAGNCGTYLASVACPPQQLLGWAADGAMWGDFLGAACLFAQYAYPGNCANWVVGHIAAYRNRIMTILAQPPVLGEQFVARYARDSKPVLGDEPGISPFAELLHAIEVSQESLAVGLRALTPQQAERVLAFGQLNMSVAEWMLFLLRHEAYHTGQLELLQEVVKAK